jgi:hypothetical protein
VFGVTADLIKWNQSIENDSLRIQNEILKRQLEESKNLK